MTIDEAYSKNLACLRCGERFNEHKQEGYCGVVIFSCPIQPEYSIFQREWWGRNGYTYKPWDNLEFLEYKYEQSKSTI